MPREKPWEVEPELNKEGGPIGPPQKAAWGAREIKKGKSEKTWEEADALYAKELAQSAEEALASGDYEVAHAITGDILSRRKATEEYVGRLHSEREAEAKEARRHAPFKCETPDRELPASVTPEMHRIVVETFTEGNWEEAMESLRRERSCSYPPYVLKYVEVLGRIDHHRLLRELGADVIRQILQDGRTAL